MIIRSKLSHRETARAAARFRHQNVLADGSHRRVEVFPPWLSPAQRRYLTGTLTLTVTSGGGGLPIVPGACGYGIGTRAAYGLSPGTQPVVLPVTNLNDGGAGSFRAACADSRPRIITFEVSGNMVLNSDINVF